MDVIKNDKGTNIGTNIHRIRLKSKISQTDLAEVATEIITCRICFQIDFFMIYLF